MQDDPTQLFQTTLDADGVLVATLDMPGRTMNVFSAGLMDALDTLMGRVEQDPAVRSVVITSGKPSFLAGADLSMVRSYTEQARSATPAQMFETCGRLGRQFVRLEACAKPWVAAVNGIALGGGLELALACRQRLVADDPKLQLGVPEVRWGLLPGAGGTQRLPRMAPFDAAMRCLLTGGSMTPAEALQWGVVDAVVPAADLLAAAKAAARALQGQPYDAARKFKRLDQAELPPYSAATARALAASHGVDSQRFDHCPAYSAICDSVLLGAHRPLAEATAVEMDQFLRLMFNPVAGRMIQTLFLERLRAERELAAPAGLQIERLAFGAISEARSAWRAALARLKLPQAEDSRLGIDVLELHDSQGHRHRLALRVLGEDTAPATLATAVLAPAGPYGRVLELVGTGPAATQAAAVWAAKLRCLPWPTPGPLSVLQSLRGLPLAQQAPLALALSVRPGAGDPVFLDVAACLAGIAPAWSGGPLSWAASLTGPA